MQNEILATVNFNSGYAFVLKNEIKLVYQKYDNIIIGTDGIFLSCYYYERPIKPLNKNWSGWQAFAGREFDLPLVDGTIEHCYGQWWDGIRRNCREIITEEIIPVTADDIKSLQNCYVFSGYYGIKKNIEKLCKEYNGPIYDYWKYQKHLKED